MNPAFDLNGRLVLITGGGTGLGRAMAEAVVRSGGSNTRSSVTQETLAAACGALGPRAHYIVNDIRNRDGIPAASGRDRSALRRSLRRDQQCRKHLKKPALKTDDAEFFEVIDTHVLSGFSLARECARRMVGRGEGSIVFIGSMSALFGLVDTPAYTASKSALRGLTRELATELSPRGVRVNIIMPGFIESQLMRGAFARDPAREQRVLARTPMAQIGTPEDIGNVAAFLMSPAARFITGAELVVDGGMSIGF